MARFWWLVKVAAAVVVLLVLGVSVYVARTWNKIWDVAAPALHASTDPAVIARGEYLVYGPAHCVECHASSPDEYLKANEAHTHPALSGGIPLPLGPMGTLYPANLTSDRETGLGDVPDPVVARMLRHGVKRDGRSSIPLMMPYAEMSDDDIVAILSFLRSLPAVSHVVPAPEWSLMGKVLKSFIPIAMPAVDNHPPKTAPPSAPTPARGEYLAKSVANCSGCHSPYNLTTGALEGPLFSGGAPMEPAPLPGVDTSLWFAPPNITPRLGSALMKFPDRDTFVARLKNGGRQLPGSPMPWDAFASMTVDDLGALYEFLHTLPASGEAAPTDPRVKP